MFIVRFSKYQELLDKLRDKDQAFVRVKERYELEERKATVAMDAKIDAIKRDYEAKLQKSIAEYEKKLSDKEVAHHKEMSTYKTRVQEDNFANLTSSMKQLHEQGNATTQFMEKITLKLMGSKPTEHIKIEHSDGSDN